MSKRNQTNQKNQRDNFESEPIQSLEDVFRESSPEAKKIKKLKDQIKVGKEKIKTVYQIAETEPEQIDSEIKEFLEIFIGPKEVTRSLNRMKAMNVLGKVSYCYSLLVNKQIKLEQMIDEMEDILNGI